MHPCDTNHLKRRPTQCQYQYPDPEGQRYSRIGSRPSPSNYRITLPQKEVARHPRYRQKSQRVQRCTPSRRERTPPPPPPGACSSAVPVDTVWACTVWFGGGRLQFGLLPKRRSGADSGQARRRCRRRRCRCGHVVSVTSRLPAIRAHRLGCARRQRARAVAAATTDMCSICRCVMG